MTSTFTNLVIPILNAFIGKSPRSQLIFVGFERDLLNVFPLENALNVFDSSSNFEVEPDFYPVSVIANGLSENETEMSLKLMRNLVSIENLHVNQGLYDQRNEILFLTREKSTEELILNDKYFGKHGRAAILRQRQNAILERRVNPFNDEITNILHDDLAHILAPLPMEGYDFRLGNMPMHLAQIADRKAGEFESPRHKFENHTGVICDFVKTLAEHFQMNVEFLNAPDMFYGPIYEDR